MADKAPWRACSVCKKTIPYGGIYYVCSVSTCNRPGKGLVFCSFGCWDAHLPDRKHRNPECVEEQAPAR